MSIPATGDRIRAYRLPAFTTAATPEAAHDITWRPEKNGPGSASFSIPMDDGAYGDIQVNDMVAIRPNGTTVAALLVEEIHEHTLDTQGGARQVATYMGRLAGAVAEWAVIAAAGGAGWQPFEQDALFDWRSLRYSSATYSDPWTAATEIVSVTSAKGGAWPTTPMGQDFTDSTGAMMCWDSSGSTGDVAAGVVIGRRSITISSPGRYGLEFLLDNYGFVWMDGIQQLEISQTEGYHRASFKRVYLSEGTHYLTWLVHNIDGPGAYAYNLFKTDHQDHPLPEVGVVAYSSDSDQVIGYPSTYPGMTVGDIIGQLLDEAQARGALTWLSPSFTWDEDSNGDPWDRELGITTKTRTTTLLQFLDELVAAGRISQWRIRPDGVTLDLFAPGYASRPTFSAPHTGGYSLTPAPVNDPRTGQLTQLDRRIT